MRGCPRLDAVRSGLHAVGAFAAGLMESACVANGLFWFLTWGWLGFHWETTAQEYARFWTHYAAAAVADRRPVEITILLSLAGLTGIVALIRRPAAGGRGPIARSGEEAPRD